MGRYDQVRSSSPSNERWDNPRNDDLELQEQRERLLSGDGDGDGDGEKDHSRAGPVRNHSPPRIRRRSWWRLALFGLAGAALVAIVGALLHQLYLSELRKEDVQTFRRHPSDYIIDPHWDYDANSTVREFHWTISDITANPDGVFRPMMVINGQFPGPMIVVNEGDTVVVNVVNQAKNATAIHWHGLFQNGTNFMDGTVGTTQCPIAPGQSFRYEFQVKGQAGSCKFGARTPRLSCHVGLDYEAEHAQISITGTKLPRPSTAWPVLLSSSRGRRGCTNRSATTRTASSWSRTGTTTPPTAC